VVEQSHVDALSRKLETSVEPLALDEESLLSATYQRWNAALSLEVLRHFLPDSQEPEVLRSFVAAQLPGRFRKVDVGIYADIAHNSEKMRALVQEIERRFAGQGLIVVMGLAGQRLPDEVFSSLARVAKTIIVTSASFKGQDPEKLRSAIESVTGDTPTLVISNPRQALGVARSLRNGADDVILLTGSTYMIEQVLNPDPYLRHMSANFGWRTQVDTEATGTVQLTLPKPPPSVR
jgi:dihydrofolate synthase / folylpolyglutamate synthase